MSEKETPKPYVFQPLEPTKEPEKKATESKPAEEFFNTLNQKVTRYADGKIVVDEAVQANPDQTQWAARPEHYPDLFVKDDDGNFKKDEKGDYVRK